MHYKHNSSSSSSAKKAEKYVHTLLFRFSAAVAFRWRRKSKKFRSFSVLLQVFPEFFSPRKKFLRGFSPRGALEKKYGGLFLRKKVSNDEDVVVPLKTSRRKKLLCVGFAFQTERSCFFRRSRMTENKTEEEAEEKAKGALLFSSSRASPPSTHTTPHTVYSTYTISIYAIYTVGPAYT